MRLRRPRSLPMKTKPKPQPQPHSLLQFRLESQSSSLYCIYLTLIAPLLVVIALTSLKVLSLSAHSQLSTITYPQAVIHSLGNVCVGHADACSKAFHTHHLPSPTQTFQASKKPNLSAGLSTKSISVWGRC